MENQEFGRKCRICNEIRLISEFNKGCGSNGLRTDCKTCQNKKIREKYHQNPEKNKLLNKQRYWKEKEKRLAAGKEYRSKNKDKIRQKSKNYYLNNKEKCDNYHEKWRKLNTENVKQKNIKSYHKNKHKYKQRILSYQQSDHGKKVRNKWETHRLKTDNNYNIKRKISASLRHFLKFEKTGRPTGSILDYSIDELKLHLEKCFLNGMSWEKFRAGEIEIHHIIPHAAFSYMSPEDPGFKLCWSLKNLRPEWKNINRELSDYLPDGTRGRHLIDKITNNNQFDFWYSRCLATGITIKTEVAINNVNENIGVDIS